MAFSNNIVLVDMDGVLADFDGAGERLLGEKFSPELVPVRSKGFYLQQRTDNQEVLREWQNILTSPGFFANLDLVEGAIDGWQSIIDHGYHPRICSAPLSTNPYCIEEKISWLGDHFGGIVADEAILTKDKHLAEGIALIDDRPSIEHAEHASWRHVVFSQAYNLDYATPFRLDGWRDSKLNDLLGRCASLFISPNQLSAAEA